MSVPAGRASAHDDGWGERSGFRRVSRWVLGRPLPSDPEERLGTDLVVGAGLAFFAFGALNLVATQLLLPLPDDSVVLSAWTTCVFMLGLVGALVGLRLGAPVRVGAHVICASSFVVVAGSTVLHGGIYSPVLILWAVLPQMVGILVGRAAAIGWLLLLVLALPAMHLAEQAGWLHSIAVAPETYFPSLVVILGTGCAAAASMAILHDRIHDSLRRSLEAERRKLRHAAGHDPLTELANRRLFEQMQEMALRRADRTKQRVALFVIDLDGFKPINDAHGHASGDHVLRVVAARLREFTRVSDSIARLGGDEFAILVELVDGDTAACVVAARIQEALALRLDVGEGADVEVSSSIGVALYPDDGATAAELHEAADTAMYAAKAAGGGRHCFFADRAAV